MSNSSFINAYSGAAKGDLPGNKFVLKKDPSLLTCTTLGHNRSLLWIATRRNRVGIVELLLKHGADVNIPGRIRSESFVLIKPYCIALTHERHRLVSQLLENGNVMDSYAMTYLGYFTNYPL